MCEDICIADTLIMFPHACTSLSQMFLTLGYGSQFQDQGLKCLARPLQSMVVGSCAVNTSTKNLSALKTWADTFKEITVFPAKESEFAYNMWPIQWAPNHSQGGRKSSQLGPSTVWVLSPLRICVFTAKRTICWIEN